MPSHPNLLAASRSWLTDLAIAGWRGIDRDLVAGVDQTLAALLGQASLRRLASLLDGFTAELAASCPGASLASVPARRWADLWSRGSPALPAGRRPGLPVEEVSGRLLPPASTCTSTPLSVQAQVHRCGAADGGPTGWSGPASTRRRWTPSSESAARSSQPALGCSGTRRAAVRRGRPGCRCAAASCSAGGVRRTGSAGRSVRTARVQLATARRRRFRRSTRHPVGSPNGADRYAVLAHATKLTLSSAGQQLVVDVERLPPLARSPPTGRLLQCAARLLRRDRPSDGTAARRAGHRGAQTVAVHGGASADVRLIRSKKSHAAAGDAVTYCVSGRKVAAQMTTSRAAPQWTPTATGVSGAATGRPIALAVPLGRSRPPCKSWSLIVIEEIMLLRPHCWTRWVRGADLGEQRLPELATQFEGLLAALPAPAPAPTGVATPL